MSNFWNIVQKELQQEERSIRWLAQKIDMPYGTVKNWIRRDKIPSADKALAIADALDENAFYLMSGNEKISRENLRQEKDMIRRMLDYADKETLDFIYDLLESKMKKS